VFTEQSIFMCCVNVNLCFYTCAGIRLVDGPSSLEGRLEVFNHDDSTWGTVCSEGFDDVDASAACHSLGYGYA
jgi:Scavenger receptor cysteine-rich domain